MALTDNIVAYYEMNGSALTTDSVGSFTLTNTNTVADTVGGKIGNGADYSTSNTNKTLSIDDSYGIILATDYTFSWWYKPTAQPGTNVVFKMFAKMFANASGYLDSFAYRDSGGIKRISAEIIRGTPNSITSNQTLTTDTFYYFVATKSGDNFAVYMNGNSTPIITETQNGSIDFSAQTTRTVLGSDWDKAAQFMSGVLDEIGIWSRALSTSEISQLYNSGIGLQYPFTGGGGVTLSTRKSLMGVGI